MTIKMIVAVSHNGVIGQKNSLPFHYKEDMKFFRSMTAESTVIMGRNTFESIGKALPKRHNIVITRNPLNAENVTIVPNLDSAINAAKENIISNNMKDDIWIIGGSYVYRDGMRYASEIYLTLIPEVVQGDNLVYFPWVNPIDFQVAEYIQLENSELKVAKYVRVNE